MSEPRIRTTVVGSYPVPDWLGNNPSEQTIADATRVILHTQETAGIDVVCDGEVYRYDLGHPETNGMIEYFVRPMAGIRSDFTFDELVKFADEQLGWRKEPAGVVEGPIGGGTLNLPAACRRARSLTSHPLKFTLTGPHMLSKTLLDNHHKDLPALCDAIADVLTGGPDADHTEPMEAEKLLTLEREGFMRMVKTGKTLARIEHTLETGKPLRH